MRIMYLTESLCEQPQPPREMARVLEQQLNDSYQLYDQLLAYCHNKGWMFENNAEQLKLDLRWAEKAQRLLD